MQEPRPAYREMTDPDNRHVLATLNPKLWAAYQRSMNRARFFGMNEKIKALERAVFMTAAMDGRGREDLRDSLMGHKPPQVALGVASHNAGQKDGVPRL